MKNIEYILKINLIISRCRRVYRIMNYNKIKILITLIILLCINQLCFAAEDIRPFYKFPDYAYMYVGNDKFEKFNRKMFSFNSGLNKYAIRPIHTVWASILPKYGIERIQCATDNIEYPIRLVSTLIQRDFKASKSETLRFLTNTTIGLGGLYDPAKSLLKIEPVSENMDQALASCKIKSGPYLMVPVITSTSPRGIAGKILDTALNPSSYIATPVLAAIKAGIFVNKTSSIQPLAKMIESTYADPYDIAKQLYGIDLYIKCSNLDRKKVINKHFDNAETVKNEEIKFAENEVKTIEEVQETDDNSNLAKNNDDESKFLSVNDILQGGTNIDHVIMKSYDLTNSKLMADKLLFDYNPQCPVVDAMRTALFELPGINDSIWTEISIWNRCFAKKIKTSSVNLFPQKPDYKFRYILQKDKNSPLAIIFPSIGESASSHHSIVLAKLFYDYGYSVIMLGSHFQWEFVNSMPDDYYPGIPSKDVEHVRNLTAKIINSLQDKYSRKFKEKVVIGTSFGAMMTLYLADKEYKENTLNITKFISINPPIKLLYAMKQIDKNNEEWNKSPDGLKEKVGITAAKVLQLYNSKDALLSAQSITLPFSDEEGKLITGFLLHQKLSDLIFTIEKKNNNIDYKELYTQIHNMNYEDYAEKYLLNDKFQTLLELEEATSLLSLDDYLLNGKNYKIYHTLDDYLVNENLLKQLKQCCGKKAVLFDHGSHLGHMYRQEFLEELKKDIDINPLKLADQLAVSE